MDLHTPVCDLLCCDEPIVLAGMGGVARAELVAAVSEAGGFGFLGMVREPPEVVLSEIEAVRSRTRRPFGVNLIPAATSPRLLEAELAVCIEAQVHAVTLFWELAPAVIRRLREAGILVLCQVGSAAEAAAAEAAGADIIIAQGWEAGGHVRGRMGLHALLANVLEVVHAPVLAAGGLVDGDDLAAVMTLGAQGAVMGTAFLATHESFAHAYHKQRIVEAAPGQTVRTDAFHINWPPGAKVRVLPNSVTRGEHGDPFAPGRQVIAQEGDRPIHLFSTDSPLRTTTGRLEAMAIYAGQGSARIASVVPAGERLATIAACARAALRTRAEQQPSSRASRAAPASPPCYAADADDGYMGFAPREELVAELNVLLEAERAGARVAARMAAEASEDAFRELARQIQADEIRWCRMLFEALSELEAEPSRGVGSFYENAMAIRDLHARLAFVNRGQAWVVRRLRALLPRVRDDGLHQRLKEMLEAHAVNIETAEALLLADSAAQQA